MNIIDIQDQLKNFSEDQLINEMQMPSGNAPQFLVLSEIQRRKRVRDDFSKRQAAQQPTVAEEAIAAAGVPQSGIAGMSEAMAPKSTMVQNAVGSAMPEAMRSGGLMQFGNDIQKSISSQEVDPFLDEVEDMAESRFGVEFDNNMMGADRDYRFNKRPAIGRPFPIFSDMEADLPFESPSRRMPVKGGPVAMPAVIPYNEGGLVGALFSKTDRGKELSSKDYEVRIGKDGRRMVFKKGTNIFLGSAEKLFDEKYDGGLIRAQQGAYFSGMPEEDIDLNDILDAIQSQESDRSKTAFGSAPTDKAMSAIGGVGERSAYQIRPETLLDFGRGYQSYQPIFPEITDQIGEGKKYATAADAYSDPQVKSMVDTYLADPSNARDAAMGILSSAYTETGDIDKAIMAYNAGLPGVLKGSQAGLPYLKGVKGRYDEMADRRQFILGGIESAMGPMAIRGLGEQYYGKGDPIIDAALEERGYRPEGMAVVTTESATATKDIETPSGEVFEAGQTIPKGTTLSQAEAAANAIPADTTGGSVGDEVIVDADTVSQTSSSPSISAQAEAAEEEAQAEEQGLGNQESATDKAEQDASDDDDKKPNVTFETPQETGISSLESEIIKLQKQMQKDRETDKWLAIAQAGLALMSSDNPTLLGAAGEAGIEGLKAFRESNERYQEGVVDLINARAKLVKDGKIKGMTPASAVSRLNAIMKALNPEDAAAQPLDPETRQRLEEEALFLRRDILNYPDIVA